MATEPNASLAESEDAASEPKAEKMSMAFSPQFVAWLAKEQVAIAFTTYQGKLLFLGHQPNGAIAGFERTFDRPMGLAGDDQTFYVASLYQIWRLANVLEPNETFQGYDRLYIPQVSYTTGQLDTHDLAIGEEGRPLFAATKFNCLGTVSDRYHFKPLWQPPFITDFTPEDRCHLNGLAVEQGRPRYVTVCSQTNVADGWRAHRHDGGSVIDVQSNKIILEGLSMPHSPRLYRDRLWLLESGTGYFGYTDLKGGKFTRLTFCPGYCRGLSFIGNYAVVGLSLSRHEPTFTGLALEDNLKEKSVEAYAGLIVIELSTGNIVHWVRMQEPVRELYEVLVLPHVAKPMAFGFKTDEIKTRVWADPKGFKRA